MGRPEVRKIREQVAVRTNSVRANLPVREDGKEVVLDVVGERAAILRVYRRTCVIERQYVRQQGCGHPRSVHRCVANTSPTAERPAGEIETVTRAATCEPAQYIIEK